MNFNMMNQARELKAKLEKAQKELEDTIIEADAGKGSVKVTMNGQQKLKSITISPKVMNPDKPEQLEELIMKAVNDASNKAQKIASKQLGGLTGGLKIPGLF